MIHLRSFFVALLLFANAFAGNSPKLTNICQFPEDATRNSGFNIELRSIPLWAVSGDDYHSLLKFPGISTSGDGTFNGQTKPYIDISGWFPKIFGTTYFITSNMLGELVGYFVPTVTGEYTFSLHNSDDAAIIYIGNPSAFPCGSIGTWPTPQEADITVCDSITPNTTLYMVEGLAYPVRISWYNIGGNGKLDAQFVDPEGTTHSDWNGYIWRYDDLENVTYIPTPSASTTTASGYVLSPTTTSTSISSYTDVNGYLTEEDFYFEEVPTSTESISVPSPITTNLGNYSVTGDKIISFYSTTGTDGRPYTASTTIYNLHSLTYNLSIPQPTTIKLGNWSITGEEVISYYSTTEDDGKPVVTSTTNYYMYNVSNSVNVPTPITNVIGNYSITGEEIISFYSTEASDGQPITGSTTIYNVRNVSHPTSLSQQSSSNMISSEIMHNTSSTSIIEPIPDTISLNSLNSFNRTVVNSISRTSSHAPIVSKSPDSISGYNQSVSLTDPERLETPTVFVTRTSLSTRHSLVTITSCDDHACNVVTETVDDIITLTTTYCPDTEDFIQNTDNASKNVSLTSGCSDGPCILSTTISQNNSPAKTVTVTTTITDETGTQTQTERITVNGKDNIKTVTEVVKVTVEEVNDHAVKTETGTVEEMYVSTVTETVDEFNTFNKVVTETENVRKNIVNKETTLDTIVRGSASTTQAKEDINTSSSSKVAQVTNTKVPSGFAVQSINVAGKPVAQLTTVISVFFTSIIISFF
ncbi:some similarities with uniprot [Nakaseomyces bracarensis]|uniref:Some similarities with uniprot n=1 Tax=Nakaseomyces bracarensis TaxID=273131 RepID=A0ABR4NTK1_9SACH